MKQWILDNLGILIGSGAGLALVRFILHPYISKFNRMHNMLIPNGGTSISDIVNRTEQRTLEINEKTDRIDESLTLLAAEHRAVMYVSTQPIFVTDKDGLCKFVNKSYQWYTGLLYQDLLGEGWTKALHPEDHGRVYELWRRSIESGTEFEIEQFRWVQSQTGRVYFCSCKATITRDNVKRMTGAVGLIEVHRHEDLI